MTHYAKTAAAHLVRGEEEEPMWRRALPWAAGAVALGGLGYAGWNALKPERPAQVPGALTNTLGHVSNTMDEAGGVAPASMIAGGVAGAGVAANLGAQRLLRSSPQHDYSVDQVLHQAGRDPSDHKPSWVATQAGMEDVSRRHELATGSQRINSLEPKNEKQAPLMERLRALNLKQPVPLFAKQLEDLGTGALSPHQLSPEALQQVKQLNVLNPAGGQGAVNGPALAAALRDMNKAQGIHAVDWAGMVGRPLRAAGTAGLLTAGAGALASAFGNKDAGK